MSKYFLVMGNTRVGSTWLSASIHQFPEAHCTREIRWMMPYQERPLPVHTYIDDNAHSMKELLDKSCSDSRKSALTLKGAKLKFDPYGFIPPDQFVRLAEIIEEDVEILLLRRDYADILGTWKTFGIRQVPNQDILTKMKEKSDPALDDERVRLGQFFEKNTAELDRKEIIISTGSSVFGEEALEYAAQFDPKDVLYYPIEEAIDDLLVLFYNDVLGLSLCPPGAARLMQYRDIKSELKALLSSLSIQATKAECIKAMQDASTRQIEAPNADLIRPSRALRDISEYLGSLFLRLSFGTLSIGDVVRYDAQRGVVSFYLPALPAIMDRHPETNPLLSSSELTQDSPEVGRHLNRRTGRWVSGRSVYNPLERVPHSGAPKSMEHI